MSKKQANKVTKGQSLVTDRRRNNWEVGETYKRQHDPYNVYRWSDGKPGVWQSASEAVTVIVGGVFVTVLFWGLAIFVLSGG